MDFPFSFNPFHFITSRDSSLAKRNLRLSLGLKVFDLLSSSSGIISPINDWLSDSKLNAVDRPTPNEMPIGLVHYLTGFTLIFIMGIGFLVGFLGFLTQMKIHDATEHLEGFLPILIRILAFFIFTPLILAGAAIAIPAIIADLALAAVFTLISLPIIWIKHKKTVAEGDALKKAVTDELEVTAAYNKQFIADINATLSPELAYGANNCNLFDYSTDDQKIFKIRFTKINDMEFKVVHLIKQLTVGANYSFLLFRNNEEGRAAFNAFVKLNICNYDEFIEKHPLIIKNSEAATRVILERINPILHTLQPAMPSKSGTVKDRTLFNHFKNENYFNYLAIDNIELILTEACNDINFDSKEKARIIHDATLKFRGKTTEQENAEKNMTDIADNNNEASSITPTHNL